MYLTDHTREILKQERDVLHQKVVELRNDNTTKGRILTKEKYHNKNEKINKERQKRIDDVQTSIFKTSDEIEIEQAFLEIELFRNSEPERLLKKQKAVTLTLRQDHIKIKTDIDVAHNRIADL